MIVQRKIEPPTFMIAPASCWSSVTLIPHSRTGVVVGLVDHAVGEGQPRRRDRRDDRLQEQVDHLAGRADANSGNGPHTGIHISSAVEHDAARAARSAAAPLLDRRLLTTPGMWVTITTALKITPATTGLAQPAAAPR